MANQDLADEILLITEWSKDPSCMPYDELKNNVNAMFGELILSIKDQHELTQEIQNIVNEHDAEMLKKNDEIAKLKKEIDDITDIFQSELKEVERERDELQKKSSGGETDSEEVLKLKEMLSRAEEERDQLKSKLSTFDLAEEREMMKQDLAAIEDENKALKWEIEELKQRAVGSPDSEAAPLARELKARDEELAKVKGDFEEALKSLEEVDLEKQDLERQKQRLQDDLDAIMSEIDEGGGLATEIARLREENEALQKGLLSKVDEYEESHETLKREMEEQSSQHGSKLESLSGEKSSLESRVGRLEALVREKTAAVDSLNSEKSTLESRVAELEGIVSEKSSAVDSLNLQERISSEEGAVVEKDALASRVAELEGIVSEKSSAVDSLNSERSSVDSAVRQLEVIAKRASAEFQSQIAGHFSLCERLAAVAGLFAVIANELVDVRESNRQLSDDNVQLRMLTKEKNREISEWVSKVKELQECSSAFSLRKELEESEARLYASHRDVEVMKAEVAKTMGMCQNLRSLNQKLMERLSQVQVQLANANKSNSSLCDSRDELESRNSELTSRVVELESQLSEKASSFEELSQGREELESRNSELTSRVAELESQLSEKALALEQLSAEHGELESVVNQLETEKDGRELTCSQLSSEVDSLRARVSEKVLFPVSLRPKTLLMRRLLVLSLRRRSLTRISRFLVTAFKRVRTISSIKCNSLSNK